MTRCSDIMKRSVRTVLPSDTVLTAARIMRDANVGFLPVCNPGGRAVGTLTDRDVTVRACAADLRPSTVRVERVMTPELVSCAPHDGLQIVEQLMATHHKSRVMVLDNDGVLLGVISLSDIVKRDDLTRAAETLRDIAARTPRL